MGHLADVLPQPPSGHRGYHGKSALCDVYGLGDIDDWRAVQGLVSTYDWATAQQLVAENIQGDTNKVTYHAFVHHWTRRCGHWTPEQRTETL